MIIGIDGNEANLKERVGVHQYAFELLNALYKLVGDNNTGIDFWIYLKDGPISDMPDENLHWRYKIISGKSLWIIKKLLPSLLKSPKPDVFFSPSHYLPPILTIPAVCTIHDLGYLEFSGQFRKYDFWQLKYWSAISMYISKYIIAVSQSAKEDIVRHYRFTLEKVEVVYHGYDKSRFNINIPSNVVRRICKKYKINGNYILFLSTLKPSKNIDGLVAAYKLLVDKGREETLVIAGKKGWLYESIFEVVKKFHLEGRVVFTDYVNELDKPALIYGCRVFVSPSYWEGFGIHVLEALACGKPVVVSRTASLPEVVGHAGLYIDDPKNIKGIADKIDKVLNMTKSEYNKLSSEAIAQAGNFSWEQSARKTLEVLIKAGTK